MNRRIKHTGWKVTTIICLIFSLISIYFNCYLIHRYNRLVDSFENNISALATIRQNEINKIELEIQSLKESDTSTQITIITISEIIQENNKAFIEMLYELKKQIGPKSSIVL